MPAEEENANLTLSTGLAFTKERFPAAALLGLHRRAPEPQGAPGAEWPFPLQGRVVPLLLQAHTVWKQGFQTLSEGRFRRMQLSVYMPGNSLVTNPCSLGIFCRQVHAWE